MQASSEASTSSHAGRQGTRVEVFESRAKRGASTTTSAAPGGARSSIYSNPLPLYVSNNDALSLLWSITWTLSLSSQILAAQLKPKIRSRNRVPASAYLDDKIQGVWDGRTKSVWVLPTGSRHTRQTRREYSVKNSDKLGDTVHVRNISGSPPREDGNTPESQEQEQEEEEGEEQHTPWMNQLWTKGFFGKGSLSRSEPTWWQREKNRVTGEHVPTAEDITSARRAERIIVKKQKAKERADEKEKQALALAERKKQEELDSASGSSALLSASQNVTNPPNTEDGSQSSRSDSTLHTSAAVTLDASVPDPPMVAPGEQQSTLRSSSASLNAETTPKGRGTPKVRLPNAEVATSRQEAKMKEMSIKVSNLEYTQLQREEVFFIALCTSSIEVFLPDSPDHHTPGTPTSSISLTTLPDQRAKKGEEPISLSQLWDLFLRSSLPHSAVLTDLERKSIRIRPDNPFIISYVVYHHYRSLGWVVRNGVKFCVDWVLYKGADGVQNMRGGAGPVGGHAEFAVAIIPTYEDAADAPTSAHLKYRRDWRWLNTVNRVCSGVKKTVILTYVTIPRMCDLKRDKEGNLIDWTSPGCLKYYNIKEVSVRRFIPTRMRD